MRFSYHQNVYANDDVKFLIRYENKSQFSTLNCMVSKNDSQFYGFRKLKDELDGLQQQLQRRSASALQNRKLVDLRLCRLCFKTKFADGVGRVCHDCQQRVCSNCGAFSKPRWNAKKNKVNNDGLGQKPFKSKNFNFTEEGQNCI